MKERVLSTEDAAGLVMLLATRIIPLAKAKGDTVLGAYLCGSFARGQQGKRGAGKYHALLMEWFEDMVNEGDITREEKDAFMCQIGNALVTCGGTAFTKRGSLEEVTIACLKQHLPAKVLDIAAGELYSDIDAVFAFDTVHGNFEDMVKAAKSINKYAYPHRMAFIGAHQAQLDIDSYSCGNNLLQGLELLPEEEVKEMIKYHIKQQIVVGATGGWIKK